MRKFILALCLLLPAPAALACGPDTDCMVGDRLYRISLPEGHDSASGLPAIVFAHGYRGTAEGVMKNGSLRRMASDLGVALIALQSRGEGWDLPNGPRTPDSTGAAEFAYLDAVLADAGARFGIDRQAVMATGFSAGGMLVWNLACARSDAFAGFAPISGTFWLEPPETCTAPVASVIHIHGDADTTVPLDGRRIGPTRQGKVSEALDMYTQFGDFRPVRAHARYGELVCDEAEGETGDVLAFCLFEGGHSFHTEFVRFAWQKLVDSGQIHVKG